MSDRGHKRFLVLQVANTCCVGCSKPWQHQLPSIATATTSCWLCYVSLLLYIKLSTYYYSNSSVQKKDKFSPICHFLPKRKKANIISRYTTLSENLHKLGMPYYRQLKISTKPIIRIIVFRFSTLDCIVSRDQI